MKKLYCLVLMACAGGGSAGAGITSDELILASSGNANVLRYKVPSGDYIGQLAVGFPLVNPADIEVRKNGNILVSNFNGGTDVIEYARDGTQVKTYSSNRIEETTAVQINGGRIYVLSNDTRRVGVFDDESTQFLYDFGADAGQFINFPHDMEFGPNNELYISVESTNDIQVWDAVNGRFIRSFGSEAQFADGLTFGPDNLLYVADFATNQIKRFNPESGAYLGVFATANGPTRVGFGPDGALYVTSLNDRNVLKYNGITGALIGEFIPAFGPALRPAGFGFYSPPVPEPASLSMIVLSATALLTRRRR